MVEEPVIDSAHEVMAKGRLLGHVLGSVGLFPASTSIIVRSEGESLKRQTPQKGLRLHTEDTRYNSYLSPPLSYPVQGPFPGVAQIDPGSGGITAKRRPCRSSSSTI